MGYGRRFLALLITVLLLGQVPVCKAMEVPQLQMFVEQPGRKSASFAVGQEHRWYIQAQVPEELEDLSEITVFQTLSPYLTLDVESVCVSLIMSGGEEILFRMGEHFDLTAGSVFVEAGIADRLCIHLTQEGMTFLSEYWQPFSGLQISYLAGINTLAPMGTQIIGTAQMNITDVDGDRWIFQSDKAAAATGGVQMLLKDPEGKPVSGGCFMVARMADEKEIDDPSVLTELLDTGSGVIPVVYERFFTTKTMDGTKTDVTVTDENGQGLCFGLAYGDYYLVQIQGRREGTLPAKPVKIRISEISHLTEADGWTDGNGQIADNTVSISETALTIPRTGGPGTIPYTVSGTLVLLCACLLLWYNREKEDWIWTRL